MTTIVRSREVVGACNGCHRLTRHAFVHVAEITPEDNPYAQRFEPQEKHDPHEIAHRNEAHRSRQNH